MRAEERREWREWRERRGGARGGEGPRALERHRARPRPGRSAPVSRAGARCLGTRLGQRRGRLRHGATAPDDGPAAGSGARAARLRDTFITVTGAQLITNFNGNS